MTETVTCKPLSQEQLNAQALQELRVNRDYLAKLLRSRPIEACYGDVRVVLKNAEELDALISKLQRQLEPLKRP